MTLRTNPESLRDLATRFDEIAGNITYIAGQYDASGATGALPGSKAGVTAAATTQPVREAYEGIAKKLQSMATTTRANATNFESLEGANTAAIRGAAQR
ncbi:MULTISPECIES: hypothetical protein [Mycobacteroides]|jgi:uncharacterized protein YukE|uniref:Uncharacterized protein n=1 Tax=Mycobacteroides chelonae TaxID=1774 RepID=A0A1S1LPN8_MYCCH|nr:MULTISPECIES: hypothetical protein [Mycobacteroides]KRQ23127.1 hypothetical protein AOT87_13875 [Mycobacteroides sp. H003]KRQ33939.1 hypothetical protein AOT91_08350 [Mycobacteroides sp. H092]KRQ39863.1 hypothetical protein AOT92_17095 [Mycobacteroides sp. H101]KRQ46548.1 hypothetical protein AOT88_18425 [Mycobacteroides sp. H063]KRQ63585.1 hypothetical protein AOT94_01645 [Mycobacteroides sp. HXVII]